jgi:biotin-dependent carboxylase-like uncharacterized protein
VSLRVIRIAAGASLQDRGRLGLRHIGVPPAGAFDRESHAIANALAGNSEDAPTVEIPLMGGRFEALARLRVAVAGSCGAVRRNGDRFNSPGAFTLLPGQALVIEPGDGVRAYLAVSGGWRSPAVAGSASGTPVQAGDVIECEAATAPDTADVEFDAGGSAPGARFTLRVLPCGNEAGFLERLCAEPRPVSLNSDRRGVRLDSDVSGAPELSQSEPTCVGAVQLTPSGQAIIVGPDGPTIGGYRRIGSVCEADLDRLAQLRPMQRVELRPCGFEECLVARRSRQKKLAEALARIRSEVH